MLGALDYGLYLRTGDVMHIVDRDSKEYVGSYALQSPGSSPFTPTPGGVSVYVPGADSLEVFSAETGQAEASFADDWVDIAGLSFSPTGERLFVLDRGSDSLIIYRHERLTLDRVGMVPMAIGGSGDLVFNGRGTLYYTLGQEKGAEGSVLINGDGLNGRVLNSIGLGFEAERLVLSANDRFAWVVGDANFAVVDLRRNRIVRKGRGSFNPESLVLEARGRRAVILDRNGDELQLFNSQNGKKISSLSIPAGYDSLLLDEDDNPWLVPDSTARPFLQLSFTSAGKFEAEMVKIAGLPSGLVVEQAVLSSIKRGGNFACF